MSDTTMSQRGDQTLVGDKVLVDLSHIDVDVDGVSTSNVTFKVYQSVANPAFPDHSTETTTWIQAGDAHATKDLAVMAAVNLAATL